MFTRESANNSKGFSFIEISWVMVCMGIILAIAVPSFTKYLRSSRLVGTSNELLTDMHYARSLAVSKRQTYQIEFDADEYRIIEVSSGEIIRQRTLPQGLSFAASDDPNFYAWGLADPVNVDINGSAGTKTVVLSANGSVTSY